MQHNNNRTSIMAELQLSVGSSIQCTGGKYTSYHGTVIRLYSKMMSLCFSGEESTCHIYQHNIQVVPPDAAPSTPAKLVCNLITALTIGRAINGKITFQDLCDILVDLENLF